MNNPIPQGALTAARAAASDITAASAPQKSSLALDIVREAGIPASQYGDMDSDVRKLRTRGELEAAAILYAGDTVARQIGLYEQLGSTYHYHAASDRKGTLAAAALDYLTVNEPAMLHSARMEKVTGFVEQIDTIAARKVQELGLKLTQGNAVQAPQQGRGGRS